MRFNRSVSVLQILSFAITALINEYYLLDDHDLINDSSYIISDTDAYISLLGEIKIRTTKGTLTESELKDYKIARLLVYLLLFPNTGCSPREIVDVVYNDEDFENAIKRVKVLIYRLQRMFDMIRNIG